MPCVSKRRTFAKAKRTRAHCDGIPVRRFAAPILLYKVTHVNGISHNHSQLLAKVQRHPLPAGYCLQSGTGSDVSSFIW